jgi:uncharacterized protein YndB with AHSA1/START domain
MLLKITIVVIVVIAGILLFAAMKPDTIRIQRSITINAPQETVFALINDFHNWPQWAPQDKQDPSLKRAFSGPPSGSGAASDWAGSGNSGQGHMRITESIPYRSVSLKVDFVKPFEAHNRNDFTLKPVNGSTEVTWTMEGSNVYMMKVMGVFVNMDRMMGKHFEDGLGNLKAVAEK